MFKTTLSPNELRELARKMEETERKEKFKEKLSKKVLIKCDLYHNLETGEILTYKEMQESLKQFKKEQMAEALKEIDLFKQDWIRVKSGTVLTPWLNYQSVFLKNKKEHIENVCFDELEELDPSCFTILDNKK